EAEGDAPKTLKKKQWLLDFANKEFGKRPIAEIKAPEILDALRKIEKRGRHETATRARGTIGGVFRFAIATGRAERDPTADLPGAEGRIPVKKMKMRRPHRVPLAHQALAILRDLQQITGGSKYLFPSVRSWHRPISDKTLNAALRRLGYDKTELTVHGLRSTASVLL